MVGGFFGLIGTIILGPRIRRFNKYTGEDEDEFRPHNLGQVALGTVILWFGW